MGLENSCAELAGGAADNQHPFLVSAQSSQMVIPVQNAHTLDGNETQEMKLSNCTKDCKTEPIYNINEMSVDVSISELLLTTNLHKLLSTEIRETNC